MADSEDLPAPTRVLPIPSRRRDKPQLSCNICRKRKLKCDRGHPCETCQRRGLSCTYVTSNTPNLTGQAQIRPIEAPGDLQDRIVQLEQLVTSLVNTNRTRSTSSEAEGAAQIELPNILHQQSNRPHLQNPAQIPDELGLINLSRTETRYVESSHWTAILDRVAGLKDSRHEAGHDNRLPIYPKIIQGSGEPDILFGNYNPSNSHQALAAIPPRIVADRLVAEYFSYKAIAPVVVHSTTFLKQYEQFWIKPQETPIIWVGLLFAVMCLARCYHQQQTTLDPECKRLIQSYRERISQCLVLGKYMKCPPYTIETLLLFLQVEYTRSQNSQSDNWICLGLIVRLALHAGYHRDASNFPGISIFDGEMRRRVWATIVQFDTLASSQVGLPSMIKYSKCDTAEPLNLLDDDLDEKMTALPTPRQESLTPIQYLVAKNKVASIHGKISDLTASIKPPAYAEVMRLDKILNNIYLSNPQVFRMLPMVRLLIDTPDIILRRIDIAILYQGAKCILHHKFMLPGGTDSQFAYSRSTCIEAALQILECHWILNHETRAGERLYVERWKISSIDKSSFFLAAALLCLMFDDNSIATDQEMTAEDLDLRQRVVQTLYISYQIWVQQSSTSKDAEKMVDALRVVLGKAQNTRLRESAGESMMLDDTPAAAGPSSRMETDPSPPQINPSPNDMSIHVLLRHNNNAEIDYSGTEYQKQPSNKTQPQDDMSDISFGFPRMYGFASDGVRKVFGGTREDRYRE